jgi:hypothetical protein
MSLLLDLPVVDPYVDGFLLLSIGSLVRFYKSEWVTIGVPAAEPGQRPNPSGTCIYRHCLTGTVQTLLYAHCTALWRLGQFQILSDGANELSACKLRTANIPFKRYSPEQQAEMKRLEYYCKAFKNELVDGRLTIGAIKKITTWLESLPLAPTGKQKRLCRGQLIIHYKLWVASGENICSLAHGNSFGTHDSTLIDIQDIIYDVVQNVLIPYPDLELKDAQGLIEIEIKRRIDSGELGKYRTISNSKRKRKQKPKEHTPPCLSTISSYRKRLDRYMAALIRDGSDKANRDHEPRGKLILPWRPHLRWEVDHVVLPIYGGIRVTDERGDTSTVIIGQIWLTVVIDVTTSFLLALLVGLDPPTVVRTIAALKIALCPKDQLFSRIPKLKNRFDVAHIPESIGIDNGKDLPGNAEDAKAILRDLNIEAELAGVARGDQKPYVEGFNSRIKRWFRKYPGRIPRKRGKFEPKDRRKSRIQPMTIEQAHEHAWRFAMDVYNIGKQAALHDESPQDLMIRGIARIEDERAQGKPKRLRSMLTKTPDEIDRMFTIRLTLTVRIYGIRHKHLRWNSGRLAKCLDRKVEVRINAENVGHVWVYDGNEGWFVVPNIHPLYAEGLSLFIHRRIRRRLIEHEKASTEGSGARRASFSMEKYLANRMELLLEFFEMAGKAGALMPTRSGRRELQLSTRSVGRAMDFAIAEGRQHALDIKANRIPPGYGQIIDLQKNPDGTPYAVSRDAVIKQGVTQYPKFEDEDEDNDKDEDMTVDPLRNDKRTEDSK